MSLAAVAVRNKRNKKQQNAPKTPQVRGDSLNDAFQTEILKYNPSLYCSTPQVGHTSK